MPQVFKIGAYLVYFWLNEGMPLEPLHVHIAEGTPTQSGTKICGNQKPGTSNRTSGAFRTLRGILDRVGSCLLSVVFE